MVRVDPLVEPAENEGIVHHIVLYYCPSRVVNVSHVGQSWVCDEMEQNMSPTECRGTTVVNAWSIGGSDFYFPENVGYVDIEQLWTVIPIECALYGLYLCSDWKYRERAMVRFNMC